MEILLFINGILYPKYWSVEITLALKIHRREEGTVVFVASPPFIPEALMSSVMMFGWWSGVVIRFR